MTAFSGALARALPDDFADGLTTAGLGAPELARARAQHAAYVEALRACGLDVAVLPADPRFPDSPFVEDTAVLLRSAAVLARPGASSRAGETAAIAAEIRARFPIVRAIEAPGTLDGGDVCDAGRRVFIGVSERTNEAGARQLAAIVESEGREATLVDVRDVPGILHLKSGIASLGEDRLLAVEGLAHHPAFADFEIARVCHDEAYAANALRIGETVLIAAGFPRLSETLGALGFPVVALEMSEFRKMDGGLSCLSLRW